MDLFNITALKAGASGSATATPPAPPAPETPPPAAPAPPAGPQPNAPAPAAPASPIPGIDPNAPAPAAPAPGTEPNVPAPAAPVQPASDATPNTPPAPPAPGTDPVPPVTPPPGADPNAPAPPVSETDTQKAEREQQTQLIAEEARKRILDELGLGSMDELKAKLAPAPEETPEQKKRREDVFKAEVQNFAVSELEMAPEDFVAIETARQLSDEELAFGVFKEKWLAANKDNEAFKGKDLAVEARYEFESLFHLESENERMKALGQESLKATADSIRAANEAKYKTAEQEYRSSLQRKAQVGSFKNTVQSSIKTHLPPELTYTVDDATFKYQLDKVDTADLEKYLATQTNFDFFQSKGGQETSQFLKGKIMEYVSIKHAERIAITAFKSGLDAGRKDAVIGAKAPFSAAPVTTPPPANAITKEDDDKVRQVAGGRY